MKFAERVFFIAGVYGLLVLLPQYFLEGKTGRDFPPPITHPEFYYGFLGVAVAWQVLFLILAKNPPRYHLMMIPAILEKLSFAVPVMILYAQQRIGAAMLTAGMLDLMFGVLFVVAYVKVAKQRKSPGSMPGESAA
ncbi:MAG TPA: hypothetical protein VKD65_03935 [Candidatus Angelobacter sp.]|nr:hypothetical protein [Candidatus Angelobacter sp.]